MPSICVRATAEPECFIQDLLYLFVGVRFFLFVHGTMGPDAFDQRLIDPSPPKSLPKETAKLGHHRRLRCVCEVGQSLNLERLKKVYIEFAHRVDAAALTVFFESAKMKFVLTEGLFAEFVFVRGQVLPMHSSIVGPSTCFFLSVEMSAARIASAVFKSRVPVL